LKIRTKITLLFTLLVTFIILALNVSVYYLSSEERKDLFRKRLRGRAANNAQIYDYYGDSSVNMLQRIDAGSVSLLPRKTVFIIDTPGRILYRYHAEAADTTLDRTIIGETKQADEKYINAGEREGVSILYRGQNRTFVIVVTAYDEDGRLRLSELKKVLGVSLLIGVLITVLVGYAFSSQLVRPITEVIHEVNNISSHNLSRRLREGISQDELNQLTRTFNDLLNRLQESFNTQKRFIANASHELSTPLTSIASQLQITLQKDRNTAEYQRVLQSIQEDVEQMRQLIKSLLEIAKAGAAQGSIELAELRMDELLLKIIADVQRINDDYQVELEFNNLPDDEKQCMVFGNPDLLYSALKNIVENGCKYSSNKTSRVEVSFKEHNILIDVINQGDVLAEQEIVQIFQPFYRGESVGDTEGFGLGLPLAKRIISLHKGEISVSSDLSGTRFSILLPSLKK
jgi:two-component system, OmpR family, sensor histidine kinase ArlS